MEYPFNNLGHYYSWIREQSREIGWTDIANAKGRKALRLAMKAQGVTLRSRGQENEAEALDQMYYASINERRFFFLMRRGLLRTTFEP